jgi:hypothetical protein
VLNGLQAFDWVETNEVQFRFSYKQYLKSRPGASAESARRIKSLKLETMGIHPLLTGAEIESSGGIERDDFLLQMKKFRPSTVSELNLIRTTNKKVMLFSCSEIHS